MGRYKSLYVSEAEIHVLDRAEAYAKRSRMKFAAVVMAALDEYLARHDEASDDDDDD